MYVSSRFYLVVDTIKVATVNCQGLATPSKRQDVLNYSKTKGFSILCLQDTHLTSEIDSPCGNTMGVLMCL